METFNDKASSASLGSADANQSKTLSRNALYAPLVAYEQTQIDPKLYMGSLKFTPVTLKEATLTSFLQKVSEDYHRNRATGVDPKNNGSRPLSVGDMDERLRQRVVTLIGGGVNSAMSSFNNHSVEKSKGRKRPRQEWDQMQKIFANTNTNSTMNSVALLREINARWNDYICKILALEPMKDSRKETSTIKARMVAARESLELVGAHVQVRTCTQKPTFVGLFGIFLGETMNIWSVAIPSRGGRKKRKRRNPSNYKQDDSQAKIAAKSGDDSSRRAECVTEIISVPKRGSSLDVIIPFESPEKENKDRSDKEPFIQQAPQSLFITLAGTRT